MSRQIRRLQDHDKSDSASPPIARATFGTRQYLPIEVHTKRAHERACSKVAQKISAPIGLPSQGFSTNIRQQRTMKQRRTQLTITLSTRPENLVIVRVPLYALLATFAITLGLTAGLVARYIMSKPTPSLTAREAPAIEDSSIASNSKPGNAETKSQSVEPSGPPAINLPAAAPETTTEEAPRESTAATDPGPAAPETDSQKSEEPAAAPADKKPFKFGATRCDWSQTEAIACRVEIVARGGQLASGRIWAVAGTETGTDSSTPQFASAQEIRTDDPADPANAAHGVAFSARRLVEKEVEILIDSAARDALDSVTIYARSTAGDADDYQSITVQRSR